MLELPVYEQYITTPYYYMRPFYNQSLLITGTGNNINNITNIYLKKINIPQPNKIHIRNNSKRN
jgi:hypothetical protein